MADVNELGGAASGRMNSGAGPGGLDSVVGAVDSALVSLDARQGAMAVGVVRRALRFLPSSRVAGVAETLEQLQQALQGGPGAAPVGPFLATLGRQTREAAAGAGPMAGVLHQLAGRLDAAGARITPGDGSAGA